MTDPRSGPLNSPVNSPARRPRRRLVAAAGAVGLALGAVLVLHHPIGSPTGAEAATTARSVDSDWKAPAGSAAGGALAAGVAPAATQGRTRPAVAPQAVTGGDDTSFRVATFNVLGASHTAPHGNKASWPDARPRMDAAVKLLLGYNIDVIGFQEFTLTQIDEFKKQTAGQFTVYPAGAIDSRSAQDSIAWRNTTWQLVDATTMPMRYFNGNTVQMPVVLLQNRTTGRQVSFANFHNPATTATYKNQQQWRDIDRAIEKQLGRDKQALDPPVPVVMTGDMNEGANFFCDMTSEGVWHAAYGGSNGPGQTCVLPKIVPIDWIMGTPEVTYTNWVRDRTTVEQKISDHPLFFADASVAPAGAPMCVIDKTG